MKSTDAKELLGMTEEAIRGNDQALACAVSHRYAEQGHDTQPFFDLMLKYAISEDGALHAEKYFQTVTEEYASTRPITALETTRGFGPRHLQRIRLPGPWRC